MLELHIENLGVIGTVDLVLADGLTAITGETGAGKTMLVEALEIVVGGRADPVIVRPGAAEARVDARFVVGDDEVVLSRVVPADGRSRAYIDGRPATATGARRRGDRTSSISTASTPTSGCCHRPASVPPSTPSAGRSPAAG